MAQIIPTFVEALQYFMITNLIAGNRTVLSVMVRIKRQNTYKILNKGFIM